MKRIEKGRLTQVCIAQGIKLVTCRNIDEEIHNPYGIFPPVNKLRSEELRHLGRCQRVTIFDITGDDYTQEMELSGDQFQNRSDGHDGRLMVSDLHHGPCIGLIDLSQFDRKPGCAIRILPKCQVRFEKVTVKICDMYGHELAHDLAQDPSGSQEWLFSYFPQRRFVPPPTNLKIIISASEKPREQKEALVDVYELPPDQMREVMCWQS